jgi:hypothetical protein
MLCTDIDSFLLSLGGAGRRGEVQDRRCRFIAQPGGLSPRALPEGRRHTPAVLQRRGGRRQRQGLVRCGVVPIARGAASLTSQCGSTLFRLLRVRLDPV